MRWGKVPAALLLVIGSLLAPAACGGATPGRSRHAEVSVSGCPPHRLRTRDVRKANGSAEELRRTLIPSGPSSLLLCRYYGSDKGPREGDLARSRATRSPRTIDRLVGALVRSSVPRGASATCENDTGAVAVGLFGYPGGRSVAVVIHLSGCEFSTNGYRIVATPEATVERILALTR